MTSNHKEDFYCLNCLHSFKTENKLKNHKSLNTMIIYAKIMVIATYKCLKKVIMYYNATKKTPFIIYAVMKSLLENMSTCHNNPKKSSTTKINKKHTPIDYSLFTHC